MLSPTLSACDRRVAVVERVGPVPGGIDRVGAVAVRRPRRRVTAWKVLAVLSTSVSVSVPVAVGVPAMALATPPASITEPRRCRR